MGSKFNINISNSTVGSLAVGDQARSEGHVTQGSAGSTQAQGGEAKVEGKEPRARGAEPAQQDAGAPIDFAILTAIEVERRAVCSAFGLGDDHRVRKGSRVYWRGRLPLKNGDFYELVVAQSPDMANVDAAILTNDTLHHWQPGAALMVGIAASTDAKKVKLGDVVAASDVYYYERGKVTPEGTKPEPKMIPADATLWSNVTAVPDWKGEVPVDRPEGTEKPKLHYGVIASGEKVIADQAVRDQIAAGHRKILAIEMEGYGFSRAVWQSFDHVRHLVIRGICDDGTPAKTDGWHGYAAATAAAFARHVLLDQPLVSRRVEVALLDLKSSNRQPAVLVVSAKGKHAFKAIGEHVHNWRLLVTSALVVGSLVVVGVTVFKSSQNGVDLVANYKTFDGSLSHAGVETMRCDGGGEVGPSDCEELPKYSAPREEEPEGAIPGSTQVPCSLAVAPFFAGAKPVHGDGASYWLNRLSDKTCKAHLTIPRGAMSDSLPFFPQPIAPSPDLSFRLGAEAKRVPIVKHNYEYVNDSKEDAFYYEAFVAKVRVEFAVDFQGNADIDRTTCVTPYPDPTPLDAPSREQVVSALSSCNGTLSGLWGGTRVTKTSRFVEWEFGIDGAGRRPKIFGWNPSLDSLIGSGWNSAHQKNRSFGVGLNVATKDMAKMANVWSATTAGMILLRDFAIRRTANAGMLGSFCSTAGDYGRWCSIKSPKAYKEEQVGDSSYYWYPLGVIGTVWRTR